MKSKEYSEEDWLSLSGIQHFSFCRRQWALIHIENQWAENLRTTEGELMHKNAHDADYCETRGDKVITRDMSVHSCSLGVSGKCDIVEFIRSQSGITLEGKDGLWRPFPVEYKRGEPSEHTIGEAMQLCVQAICLEEMLCCDIPAGALYYGKTRHRFPVEFTPQLREKVAAMFEEMHGLFERGTTPKVKPTKSCNACSLKELCLPALMRRQAASAYIRSAQQEEE